MRKLLITMVLMISFVIFTVSCGEGDPDPSYVDDSDKEEVDEDEVADEDEFPDEAEYIDEEVIEEPDEAHVEEPEEESPFEKIGDFNLSYDGQINVDLSNYMSIRGGNGNVNFSYNMIPYTFGELSVLVQLFPLAILQQGNVAVLWLDSAPGLGAEVKQVFGFTFPSTIQPGEQSMETAQAFAFYGDIDVNVQAGQFDVRCVRAASYQGNLNVIFYDENNANFTASGDLLDPTAAGSQLPYPVCTD